MITNLFKQITAIFFLLFSTVLYTQDGALDLSFDVGTGFNQNVRTIALQPDGKILIGGLFIEYNGQTQNFATRLNTDGTLDTSFNSGTGFSLTVLTIVLQPDGKILVGGAFTQYNGHTRNRIIRLNTNGTLDTSFNIGSGFNSTVYTIALQPDGKILVGGNFTQYNGQIQNRIVRLYPDGTLDSTFNIGTGFNQNVRTISLQPDGKILVGGSFTQYNGQSQSRIARLHPDGTLDTSFNIGEGFNGFVIIIASQSNGRILVGGNFTQYKGQNHGHIICLFPDGTIDTSFNTGVGFNGNVHAIVPLPDGRILVGGVFTLYNTQPRKGIVRLYPDGILDISFEIGSGFDFPPFSGIVRPVVTQPDGRILVGGHFTQYNGQERNNIARLTTNYTIQTTSNPTDGGITTGGGSYNYEAMATVTATVNTGYTFVNWTENATEVSTNSEYSFSVEQDRDLTANFTLINTYVVSVNPNPTEGGTVSGGGTYNYGATATVTATANTDYSFVNWTENGTEVSTNLEYSFIVEQGRNLTANFTETMSVSEWNLKNIVFYPNPFDDFLYIENQDSVSINKVMVYDISGKFIKEEQVNNSTDYWLNGQYLPAGTYFIKVYFDKGEKTFKTIKR